MQNYIEITDKNFTRSRYFTLHGITYYLEDDSYYHLVGIEDNNLDVINIYSQVKYKNKIYQLTCYRPHALDNVSNSSEINVIGKNPFCTSYDGVFYAYSTITESINLILNIYPPKKKDLYYVIPNHLPVKHIITSAVTNHKYLKYLIYRNKIIKINNKLGSII